MNHYFAQQLCLCSHRWLLAVVIGCIVSLGLANPATAQQEHVIFVSDGLFNVNAGAEPNPGSSDFGGLSSADFQVTRSAFFAGLLSEWNFTDRIYTALLSDSTVNARDRVAIGGRVVNTNGDLIATDQADLWDGTITNAINYTEFGDLIPNHSNTLWSGSNALGENSFFNCLNWTQSSSQIGSTGSSEADTSWFSQTASACDQSYRLVGISPLEDVLPGDFDRNEVVEAADLIVWQTHYGSTTNVRADGDFDNDVDGGDFLVWQRQLGQTAAVSAAVDNTAAVPEPTTLLMMLFGVGSLLGRSRQASWGRSRRRT